MICKKWNPRTLGRDPHLPRHLPRHRARSRCRRSTPARRRAGPAEAGAARIRAPDERGRHHPAYVYDLLAEPRSFAEVDRAAARARGGALAGRDPRHDRALRAPADAHARARVRRRGRAAPAARSAYRALGWDVVRADRGGRSTWHGPGQLVCYPILDLRDHGKDLRRYAHDLERVVIEALADARHRGRRRRGSRARRRLGRGPQDRVARHPRRQLGRAPRLRAQRRLRPRPRSRASAPAGSTRRRSRASPRSSAATSRVADAREPVLDALARVSRARALGDPRPDAPALRHHDLRVEHGAAEEFYGDARSGMPLEHDEDGFWARRDGLELRVEGGAKPRERGRGVLRAGRRARAPRGRRLRRLRRRDRRAAACS